MPWTLCCLHLFVFFLVPIVLWRCTKCFAWVQWRSDFLLMLCLYSWRRIIFLLFYFYYDYSTDQHSVQLCLFMVHAKCKLIKNLMLAEFSRWISNVANRLGSQCQINTINDKLFHMYASLAFCIEGKFCALVQMFEHCIKSHKMRSVYNNYNNNNFIL